MDYADSRYYKLNKRLLSMVYLWPYQTSRCTRVLRVFIQIILLYGIVGQVLVLVRKTFMLDDLLQLLPYITVTVIYALKYQVFLLTLEKTRELIDKIRCQWIAVACHEEYKILDLFANQARLLGLLIAYTFYAGLIGFFVMGLLPEICDVIMPLNESRAREFPIVAEFYVNQEKYRYLLLLHMNLTVFLGVTTIIATESIMATILAHGCGLFKITQYRIRNILYNVSAAPRVWDQQNKIICRRIVDAAHMYQIALEFVNLAASSIEVSYFPLLLLGVLVSAFNLYAFSQALSVTKAIEDVLFCAGMLLAQFVYMFYVNYIAQQLTDHNAEIFTHLYDWQWYKCPLPAQKLLLLFMQSATRNCTVVVGGVFVASMEGLSSIVQMSFSYFMVIYSRP